MEKAEVIIASRSTEKGNKAVKELGKVHSSIQFYPVDLGNTNGVSRLFKELVDLDILVNNAGNTHSVGKGVAEINEDEFDRSINVNLKGVWQCMKEALNLMNKKDPPQGRIINISSINGLGGVANGSVYAATKAGVLALTKSAALEYAKTDIHIHSVVPGAVDTKMLEEAISKQAAGNSDLLGKIKSAYKSHIPAGRIADPKEIAKAVVWLAKEAPPYMVGQSLIIDGGLSTPYV